jgi:hypothetical protein
MREPENANSELDSSPRKPTLDDICKMLGQAQVGVRRPTPYRPVRLVFRIEDGVHAFEIQGRGNVGVVKGLGRFHVVAPSGKTEIYYYDELVEAGFVDELAPRNELETRGESRAAS